MLHKEMATITVRERTRCVQEKPNTTAFRIPHPHINKKKKKDRSFVRSLPSRRLGSTRLDRLPSYSFSFVPHQSTSIPSNGKEEKKRRRKRITPTSTSSTQSAAPKAPQTSASSSARPQRSPPHSPPPPPSLLCSCSPPSAASTAAAMSTS